MILVAAYSGTALFDAIVIAVTDDHLWEHAGRYEFLLAALIGLIDKGPKLSEEHKEDSPASRCDFKIRVRAPAKLLLTASL